ncbi:hypothetical protein [Streptomyces lutosisoli]|uniref:Uncharacterized protein n=1 Tax=Streptomyces lutosisoli TaxID=2665721 RepID=A0ABW2V992_9ACTN
MTPPLSRRALLRTAILLAAAPGVSYAATGRASAATLPASAVWTLRPFQLGEVTLGQGLFTTSTRRTRST